MLKAGERLIRCFKKQPIDKVPIATYDVIGSWMDETSWENNQPSYKKLMDAIKKNTECMYVSYPDFTYKPNQIVECESWDEGGSQFSKTTYHLKDRDLTQLNRNDEGINTTWTLKHLLDDISDIDAYLSIPYEPPEISMETFEKNRKKLGDNGIMVYSLGDAIGKVACLFEMGTFLIHAVTEPKKIKYFLDAMHERVMYDLRRVLIHDVVKDAVFAIWGPEYATPPYLSPEYFHDFVTCYLIDMCREIKQAGAIPHIHCHGKIARVLDQFAMTDAEGIDPVEPVPDGDIELAETWNAIKQQY